ncbi:hypothetical protein X975_11169, partial [Stegodyphus mimosarum]
MNMKWQYSSFSRPKKARTSTKTGKVMLTSVFHVDGPLLLEWLPTGTTVTAATYCATLQILRQTIKNLRLGILSCGVILLYDNARPHVAVQCQTVLWQFR